MEFSLLCLWHTELLHFLGFFKLLRFLLFVRIQSRGVPADTHTDTHTDADTRIHTQMDTRTHMHKDGNTHTQMDTQMQTHKDRLS